jgi:hypothetical protein
LVALLAISIFTAIRCADRPHWQMKHEKSSGGMHASCVKSSTPPYSIAMHRVIRIVFLITLALVSTGARAPGQQASASPAKPNPAPTPIPLAKVPLEAQSVLASLQEIDASLSKDQSSADGIARTLSDLTNEIDASNRWRHKAPERESAPRHALPAQAYLAKFWR